MRNNSLGYAGKNVIRVAKLRREMSVSEKVLWERLRGKGLGFKFRRQHPVGDYVLDFYCPEAAWCVEVDGPHHVDRVYGDNLRAHTLTELGVYTIRIPTEGLWEPTSLKFSDWLETIAAACEARSKRGGPGFETSEAEESLSPPPAPSPDPLRKSREGVP